MGASAADLGQRSGSAADFNLGTLPGGVVQLGWKTARSVLLVIYSSPPNSMAHAAGSRMLGAADFNGPNAAVHHDLGKIQPCLDLRWLQMEWVLLACYRSSIHCLEDCCPTSGNH
ncbi:hypothetical protein ACLOJK_014911 [Asimina triloba]